MDGGERGTVHLDYGCEARSSFEKYAFRIEKQPIMAELFDYSWAFWYNCTIMLYCEGVINVSKEGPNRETVSAVFNYLLERSGDKVPNIAEKIDVSADSLYTIKKRQSDRVNIKLLKKIADYFGEDVSIFCGLENYERPVKLTKREIELVELFRGLSESDIELVKILSGFSESDKTRMARIAARLRKNPGQMEVMENFLSITDRAVENVLAGPRSEGS